MARMTLAEASMVSATRCRSAERTWEGHISSAAAVAKTIATANPRRRWGSWSSAGPAVTAITNGNSTDIVAVDTYPRSTPA